MGEKMTAQKKISTMKAKSILKRVANGFKILIRNKRGMIGVTVLIFYISIALLAPIIAPVDPVWDWSLAGWRAKPEWFLSLGIDPTLVSNLSPITAYDFKSESDLQKWNISESALVNIQYNSTMGKTAPGCVAFTFTRQAGQPPAGSVKANLTQQFYYPFNGPPERILFTFSMRIEATTISGKADFGVPIDFRLFIVRETENETKRFDLWPRPYFDPMRKADYEKVRQYYDVIRNSTFIMMLGENPLGPQYPPPKLFNVYNVTQWVTPDYVDSYHEYLIFLDRGYRGQMYFQPTIDIFNSSATYYYGVEVTFKDTLPTAETNYTTTVFVDDLSLAIRGNAYGLLGTDEKGRDIFAQLVHGARISLIVGILSASIGVTIGLIVGLVAAYSGGIIDEILMRFNDLLIVIPNLPLLLVLVAVLGPSLWNVILILGLMGWMGFARLVRSQVLSLKERPFVESAKAAGASKFYIMTRHIVPNVMSLVWVSLATSVPGAILAESALSWLGFYDPWVMTWGRILHDVTQTAGAVTDWWWMLPPGISIGLIALAFILIGFTLDDILNPKLRTRR